MVNSFTNMKILPICSAYVQFQTAVCIVFWISADNFDLWCVIVVNKTIGVVNVISYVFEINKVVQIYRSLVFPDYSLYVCNK